MIRPERQADISTIERIQQLAFEQPSESELVKALRNKGAATLSLVAETDGQLTGHILFSPVTIEGCEQSVRTLGLGPLAVLPTHRGKGIGSQLIRQGLEQCRLDGWQIVVLVGEPDYYSRFGFIPALPQGLKCEFNVPPEAWMVCELQNGALASTKGLVRYDPEFSKAI